MFIIHKNFLSLAEKCFLINNPDDQTEIYERIRNVDNTRTIPRALQFKDALRAEQIWFSRKRFQSWVTVICPDTHPAKVSTVHNAGEPVTLDVGDLLITDENVYIENGSRKKTSFIIFNW
jgi:hypothetical protein